MADQGNYMSFMVDYWGSIAQDAAARMQTASQEIADREYTPGKLLSDVVGFWMFGMDSWLESLLANSSAEVPAVVFRVSLDDPSTSVKTRGVPVRAPGTEEPECDTIYRISGPPGSDIHPTTDNLVLELSKSRRVLTIRLKGLDMANLLEGLYEGLITIEERPLATMYILATGIVSASRAKPRPRGRRRK